MIQADLPSIPHALSTPSRTAPSRRKFIGGAALLAGAPATALADARLNPDAAMITACVKYHRVHALMSSPGHAISDDECDELCDQRFALLGHIAGWTPATTEGLKAKAGVGFGAMHWQLDGRLDAEWREQATPTEIIAVEVLRDLAGVTEPVKVLRPSTTYQLIADGKIQRPDLDAELLAACEDFHVADAQADAAGDAADNVVPGTAEFAALNAAWRAACRVADDIGASVMQITPVTHAGLAAKARVAQAMVAGVRRVSDPQDFWDHAITDRLLADVVNLLGWRA
jgi:hypothetical protein